MATLTIRDLDEALKRSLSIRAASRNRSMEEEARQILRAALEQPSVPSVDLASRIRARFAGLGDVQLRVAERAPVRPPPIFGQDSIVARSSIPAKRMRRKQRP
ncbi:MAG: FitA-like ribbon-helix-helix domain-containing protein [Burkholderiales bacterium]